MKTWTKPQATVEKFVVNSSVSTCAQTPSQFTFTCDAKRGIATPLYYYPRKDENADGVHNPKDRHEMLPFYHPCNNSHVTNDMNEFYDGFIDLNRNGRQDNGEGVIVWYDKNKRDYHATTKLNVTKYDKNLS